MRPSMRERSCWYVPLLVACLAWTAAGAHACDTEALRVDEIADGVYVHRGHEEESSAANRGDIANIGFIVGTTCVAVIDTGGTAAIGRALRDAVRRVTALPVCYVINTHVHPDHVFGNAAFTADETRVVGHARLPAAMAARGEHYRRALERELGAEATGSTIVAPTLLVERDRVLDLGDRALRLHAWPTGHTDNDLTVRDEKTDTWWLADLLFVEHVPVVDGSLRGWLAIIGDMRRMAAPAHVVPGHGPIDPPWPEALADEEHYLAALAHDVRAAIKEGRTMQRTIETVEASGREHWVLDEQFHRRNVTAAYAELEWED